MLGRVKELGALRALVESAATEAAESRSQNTSRAQRDKVLPVVGRLFRLVETPFFHKTYYLGRTYVTATKNWKMILGAQAL